MNRSDIEERIAAHAAIKNRAISDMDALFKLWNDPYKPPEYKTAVAIDVVANLGTMLLSQAAKEGLVQHSDAIADRKLTPIG